MTIKEARAKSGLSQAEAAKYIGVPKRTLEDWEAGKRTPPAYVETWAVDMLSSKRYFCGNCGTKFSLRENIPHHESGWLDTNIYCPRCGVSIYEMAVSQGCISLKTAQEGLYGTLK